MMRASWDIFSFSGRTQFERVLAGDSAVVQKPVCPVIWLNVRRMAPLLVSFPRSHDNPDFSSTMIVSRRREYVCVPAPDSGWGACVEREDRIRMKKRYEKSDSNDIISIAAYY